MLRRNQSPKNALKCCVLNFDYVCSRPLCSPGQYETAEVSWMRIARDKTRNQATGRRSSPIIKTNFAGSGFAVRQVLRLGTRRVNFPEHSALATRYALGSPCRLPRVKRWARSQQPRSWDRGPEINLGPARQPSALHAVVRIAATEKERAGRH